MKKVISIHEAKANFSKYVRLAKAGEEILIGSFGLLEVKLVPAKKPKVPYGFLKKKIKINADIVGSDLEVVRLFEGSKLFPGE